MSVRLYGGHGHSGSEDIIFLVQSKIRHAGSILLLLLICIAHGMSCIAICQCVHKIRAVLVTCIY